MVSSDLGRAYHTTQIIMKANNFSETTPVIKSQLAREYNAGAFQGNPSHPYRKFFRKAAKKGDYRTVRPEGGETFEELFGRMKTLLYRIIDFSLKEEKIEEFSEIEIPENGIRSVLVVGHGAWLRMLQDFLEKEIYGLEYKIRLSVKNCSLSLVNVKREEEGKYGFDIEMFGDTEHFNDEEKGDSDKESVDTEDDEETENISSI